MQEEEAQKYVGRTVSLVIKNRFSGGYLVRTGKLIEVRGGILSLVFEKDHFVNFPLDDVESAEVMASGEGT